MNSMTDSYLLSSLCHSHSQQFLLLDPGKYDSHWKTETKASESVCSKHIDPMCWSCVLLSILVSFQISSQCWLINNPFLRLSLSPDNRIPTEENIDARLLVVIDLVAPDRPLAIAKDNHSRTQTTVYSVTLQGEEREEKCIIAKKLAHVELFSHVPCTAFCVFNCML